VVQLRGRVVLGIVDAQHLGARAGYTGVDGIAGTSGLLRAAVRAVGVRAPVLGNDARVLVNEAEAMPAITDALRSARRSVRVTMYSWQPSGAGATLASELRAAAGRDVDVHLRLDASGSGLFPGSDARRGVDELRAAGVHVEVAGHWWDEPLHATVDHRKLVVVDDEVAFVGGMNMAAMYSTWQDTMLELRGPVVEQLGHEARYGGTAARRAGGPALPVPSASGAGDTNVTVLANDIGGERGVTDELLERIRASRTRVWAETPFLGSRSAVDALVTAARNGADVHVAVVAPSAFPVMPYMSRTWYRELLDAGVTVHEVPRMSHRKLVIADDEAIMGSANLTRRSATNDAEVAVALRGPVVEQLAALAQSDFAGASSLAGPGAVTRAHRVLGFAPIAGAINGILGRAA
jgi:cardiolipin synthase